MEHTIVGLSHSHLHRVYYFYHVNSSEHNNYNLFSIFEIIKQKKSKQNKYAVWVNKHSQNYFLLSKRL